MNQGDSQRDSIVIALIIALIGIIVGATYYSTSQIAGEIKDARDLILHKLDRISYQIQYLCPVPTPTPSPTPPTITPKPTPTPPTPFVDITKPKDKDKVSWRYTVEGSSSATKDSGESVYVLIWPVESDGPWWVQPTTTFSDGSWQSYAYFGRDPRVYPEDIGTSYRVVAIITKQELRGGQTFRELPDHIVRSKEIIVTRT